VDTAAAIGDTLYFASTIADKNGSILVGARPTWTTGDTTVAVVRGDGGVVARAAGTTTVTVVVGALTATSRIVVKQRVAGVELTSSAGDSTVIAEGAQLPLRVRALDARGNIVPGRQAIWNVDDSTVASLDARGVVTGRNAGRTVVSANIEGASGYLGISVVTTAKALALVAGADQRAFSGRALPQGVVVRATNRQGAPTIGKLVKFRTSDGQGLVLPDSIRTDADGRARTQWTLSETPGRQMLLATVESLDSTVMIVAEADPIASRTRVTALVDSVVARGGEPVSDSIGVRVIDSTGRALPDVPVRWTTPDGGSAEGLTARTDSNGIARVRWTLGTRTGTQRLRAQVGHAVAGAIAPISITATALAGAPAEIRIVGGDKQRATVSSALGKPIAFRVVDSAGNGVANTKLVLSPSGGALTDSVVTTDSVGDARTRWTMGRSAGEYTLGVHVAGMKKLPRVAATARPGKPANLSFDDVPAKERGTRASVKKLYALVTDLYGNPVPDVRVNFITKSGTVSPARAVTDARGRVAVSWTISTKPDEQKLTGLVNGTSVTGAYVTAGTTRTKTR
jgi:hypothetical protein